MNIPKVSIIIPVYNVAPYLAQCLDSVINQSLPEIEIILVDDGSTDNSAEICADYALKDSRIKLLSKPNGGLSSARNAGHEHVTAKYLMYLDSDDWINLETCEIALKAIEENNADLVFWTRIKEFPNYSDPVASIFREKTIFEGENIKFLHRRIAGLIGEETRIPTQTDAISSAWGKLYRFEIIKQNKVEFTDTKLIGSEDTLFNFDVFYYLKKAVFINEYLNHYRKDNPNSLTKNHKSSLMPRYLNLFNCMELLVSDRNLDEKFTKALKNRVAFSTINIVLSITSSNNLLSTSKKIFSIKETMTNPKYVAAYQQLDLNSLPLHWKTFFTLARMKSAYGIYAMSILMRRFRKE